MILKESDTIKNFVEAMDDRNVHEQDILPLVFEMGDRTIWVSMYIDKVQKNEKASSDES